MFKKFDHFICSEKVYNLCIIIGFLTIIIGLFTAFTFLNQKAAPELARAIDRYCFETPLTLTLRETVHSTVNNLR